MFHRCLQRQLEWFVKDILFLYSLIPHKRLEPRERLFDMIISVKKSTLKLVFGLILVGRNFSPLPIIKLEKERNWYFCTNSPKQFYFRSPPRFVFLHSCCEIVKCRWSLFAFKFKMNFYSCVLLCSLSCKNDFIRKKLITKLKCDQIMRSTGI